MREDKSKYHRLTFSQFFQMSISCQKAQALLAEQLSLFKKNELLNILCQIGKELHLNSSKIELANNNLLNRFPIATIYSQKLLETHKELDGSKAIIFDPKALRILNAIILVNFTDFASNIMSNMSQSNSYGLVKNILVPTTELSKPSFGDFYPIIPLFLLSNEIVNHIENEAKQATNRLAESTNYYFNVLDDPLSVLGRAYKLFNTDYFNNKIHDILGVKTLDVASCFFILYTQILTHDPARIESDNPCKNSIPEENERIKLKNVLGKLSLNYKSRPIKDLWSYLKNSYYGMDENIFKGKPYTNFENLLYCIRPDFYVTTMCDFPYFLVLNSLQKKEESEFSHEFGKIAFENYIKCLAYETLGENVCPEYIYKRRKGEEIPCGEFIIEIDDHTVVIVEVKGAKEDEFIRTGEPQKTDDKFVTMPNKRNKAKGVRQLFNDAKYYRTGKAFNGDVYTLLVFYGRFPETEEFNEIIINKIHTTSEYKEYKQNPKNHEPIWLNCFAAELMFSALRQNKNLLKNLIQNLSKFSPSSITSDIWEYMKKNNLKTSLSPLFDKELKLISSHAKKLLKPDTQ